MKRVFLGSKDPPHEIPDDMAYRHGHRVLDIRCTCGHDTFVNPLDVAKPVTCQKCDAEWPSKAFGECSAEVLKKLIDGARGDLSWLNRHRNIDEAALNRKRPKLGASEAQRLREKIDGYKREQLEKEILVRELEDAMPGKRD